MIYIGIDPGLSGAVAVIDGDGQVKLYDTPIVVVKNGSKERRKYSAPDMAGVIFTVTSQVTSYHAVIESVHAMPEQGVSSSFNFGHGLGLWEGILAANKIPYEMTTPQRWKGLLMDGMGKEKDASRLRAKQLFPMFANQLNLKKHHGRADALLLAEYGRRIWRQNETTTSM